MSRELPSWRGATDDAAIPDRVKVRLIMKSEGYCAICGIKILATKDFDFDHKVALINGGEHAEANLQVVHRWCHKTKTAADVKQKARDYRKRKSNYGIKPKSKFACSKDSPYRKKINGRVELRRQTSA